MTRMQDIVAFYVCTIVYASAVSLLSRFCILVDSGAAAAAVAMKFVGKPVVRCMLGNEPKTTHFSVAAASHTVFFST